MTEKERLSELLEKAIRYADENYHGRPFDGKFCGLMADYLLANGVILPSVKIGQTVYSLEKGIYSQFFNGEVYEIQIRREGVVFRATRRGYYTLAFTEENIGKTVFFTPEEAEAALAERSKT